MLVEIALLFALAGGEAQTDRTAQIPLNAAERAGQARLERLGWLAGEWQARPRPLFSNEEIWSAPRRGSMLGMARELFDQRTRSFEFMRIAVERDGRLGFYASPGGAAAVRFGVVQADETALVAENPAHDYPQRITYRRSGATVTATVSMLDGSQAESWTYSRAAPGRP